jgi:hypothetical protein
MVVLTVEPNVSDLDISILRKIGYIQEVAISLIGNENSTMNSESHPSAMCEPSKKELDDLD